MSYSSLPPLLMSMVISAYNRASILLRVALFQSDQMGGDTSVQQITEDGLTHALPSEGRCSAIFKSRGVQDGFRENGSATARSSRTFSYGMSMFFCAYLRSPIMEDIRVI